MALRAPPIILIWCLTFFFTVSAGSDAVIKIRDFEKCDCDGKNLVLWNYELNNLDSDEWKELNLNITFEEDLTERWTYSITIDKLNNGDWEENIYNDNGKLCELISKFAKGAWRKLMQNIKPMLTQYCYAKKGTYVLEDFEVLAHDVDFKSALFGSLRLKIKLMNEQGENVFCNIAYVDVYDK